MIAMAAPPRTRTLHVVRCGCGRLVFEYDNQIVTGKVTVEMDCKRCGKRHTERIDAVSN